MNILNANITHLNIVSDITCSTIKEVYPKYYPMGAVEFFISHHSEKNILTDIKNGRVYLLKVDNQIVGTVTIKSNEICRLFVLPKYQGLGYGKYLLDFAENEILKNHDVINIDASLSTKGIYLKRGYKEVEYNKILTPNGDYLCYDVMVKKKSFD